MAKVNGSQVDEIVIKNALNNTLGTLVVTDSSEIDEVYDTVQAMVNDKANLSIGDKVMTRGYYAADDGGGTVYKIEATNHYVGYITLASGSKYANLVEHGTLNALSLGFKRDGSDNKTYMDAIVSERNADYALGDNAEFVREQIIIFFPSGMYAFSPTTINTSGLILEGEGNSFVVGKNFVSTIFCPGAAPSNSVYSQDFVIMVGDDTTTSAVTGGDVYVGNGIKNIQFTTNKWHAPRHGAVNNYQVDAALVIYKQYMSQFYDLSFYFCKGSGLKMASSWECHFTTLMFRNMYAQDTGALNFANDFLSAAKTSDCSSNYFGNMEFEAIAGPYINLAAGCKLDNNAFNSIIVEDYRLDMPDRVSSDSSLSWGTTWTDSTWLPSGKSAPDVEFGIFNVQAGASFSNNTIGNITGSMYAVRSYTIGNSSTVYTHDAIVSCFGIPKKLDFQCDMVNIQLNKADIKTLIYNFTWTPIYFNFVISNAIMNDSTYNFVLDGVCRNYVVNDNRVMNTSNKEIVNGSTVYYPRLFGYENAYDYAIASSIKTTIDSTNAYTPLGRYNYDSYAKNKVALVVVDRSIFDSGNNGVSRIPIVGRYINVRIYQGSANSICYRVCNSAGTTIYTGNIGNTSAGWSWVSIDLKKYMQSGYYLMFYNDQSATNATGNLIDVFYWNDGNDGIEVTYKNLDTSTNSSWILLKISRLTYKLEFHHCSGNDNTSPTTLTSNPLAYLASHLTADIATNCNYGGAYYPGRLNGRNYNTSGSSIDTSRRLLAYNTSSETFNIYAAGTQIANVSNEYDVAFAVDLPLISNGSKANLSTSTSMEPRNVFGWNDDYYFVLLTEGRGNLEKGMLLADCRDILYDAGATEAINFDGGGSVCLAANIDGSATKINKTRDVSVAYPSLRNVGLCAVYSRR